MALYFIIYGSQDPNLQKEKARIIQWRAIVLEEFITVLSDHYQKGNVLVVLEQYSALIEKEK